MNTPLPSRGDDILSWARSITAGVNALAPIGGRGTLVKESANGFGFEGLPKNKRTKSADVVLPWSFVCTVGEDPETHEETRTGGWVNCRMQIGYQKFLKDDDIEGTDLTDDGKYYIEVDLRLETAEIKVFGAQEYPPYPNIEHSIIYIPIGEVEDAKLIGSPIGLYPVVYKYV